MSTRYRVILEPKPGIDDIKALRRLFKHAGRYLGLRAIDARAEPAPTSYADAFGKLHRDVRSRLRERS